LFNFQDSDAILIDSFVIISHHSTFVNIFFQVFSGFGGFFTVSLTA